MTENRQPAILVLEDGRVFHGKSFAAIGQTFGEGVFATGMSGYQETLTDPSYYRQIVLATAPHIGNTGWNDDDDESSRIWVAGYVVRDPARRTSNWRANRSLEDELVAQHIVGICELDTRALTRHLRDAGTMRMGISSTDIDEQALLAKVKSQPLMAGANLISQVTTDYPYTIEAIGVKKFDVVALDLGVKKNSLQELARRGLRVHVVPASFTWEQIQAYKPDGLFVSNGPGDPATADHEVSLVKKALEAEVPVFGICFGNQILGRALGFDTYKLKYGHRGINQPVLDKRYGRIDITAHNHGFAVSVPLDRSVETEFGRVAVSHVCLNDNVVEGLELTRNNRLAALSVQYHPEAAAGPHDAEYLFDRFVKVMENA
uniref:glutamine-hydrolyzing carbamoyl-phosphate synthase small subunit n=1 Tax=Vaginimicrobium propionicum TaxID=1871034 RepID=UPI0009707538|nr:glutamine-hydrolyzing carbamoyl-phosphate synthase small subunit [Vaginimicrobium propionicum]